MSEFQIRMAEVAKLVPYAGNARVHSDEQIQKVAASIQNFGFMNPIIVDEKNVIIAGHGRVLAAKTLAIREVPTLCISHLSKAEISAYRLADNRLAEISDWNEEALRDELEFLSEIDIDFDIEFTGFDQPEIDELLNSEVTENTDILDQDLPRPQEDPIVIPGDIFTLGRHRIICGDCRDLSVMSALMGEDRARFVFSEVPHNMKTSGHVLVPNKSHDEFAMASGEMNKQQFTEFLQDCFQQFYDFSLDGAIGSFFMDWRHLVEILAAGEAVYDNLIDLCVWMKSNAGTSSSFMSAHNLVFLFKKGRGKHVNSVQISEFERSHKSISIHASASSFDYEPTPDLAFHPTVKPVRMIADAILDATKSNDIVLDGFLGLGTTVLAAEQTGRVCYGCEIAPQYVEVCIQRFSSAFREPVIHDESGFSFFELKAQRLRELVKEGT